MLTAIDNLLQLISQKKAEGKKIVFTNGCFDILHSGHVRYLNEAKSLGDILIIGLNSDSSVKRLKGEDRPINNEEDRAIVLSGLRAVDYVVLFNENTPYKLISLILPDVLVKGGDWKQEEIVGYDIVKKNGGEVVSSSYYDGKSTSRIIAKVKD